MSSSCSFRITRTAEDLAHTMSAISQKLVQLEARIEAIEIKADKSVYAPPAEEIEILNGVDQILRECQDLLETPNQISSSIEAIEDDENQDFLVA